MIMNSERFWLMEKNMILCILVLLSISVFAQSENTYYSEMYECILRNDLEGLSSYLEKTGDINSVESDGYHLFECVFIMSNCEAAEMLLAAGLDVDYRNKDGLSLEEMIIQTKNKRLISLMVQYKDNAN